MGFMQNQGSGQDRAAHLDRVMGILSRTSSPKTEITATGEEEAQGNSRTYNAPKPPQSLALNVSWSWKSGPISYPSSTLTHAVTTFNDQPEEHNSEPSALARPYMVPKTVNSLAAVKIGIVDW